MLSALRRVHPTVAFAVAALLFIALTYTPLCAPLNEFFCAISYRVSNGMLDALGIAHQALPAHRVIRAGAFGITIDGLCSGMRGNAIWWAAVLFLPVSRWQKVIHFFAGTAVLALINCVRITHLVYVGAHSVDRFKVYHSWVWPTAILGIILAYRAIHNVVAQHHLAPTTPAHA